MIKVVEVQISVAIPNLGNAGDIIGNKGRDIEYHPDNLGGVVRITQNSGTKSVWLIPMHNVAWMLVG